MAVLGLVPKIDLPFGVPITLQSLGVMLAGCLLGGKRGAEKEKRRRKRDALHAAASSWIGVQR
jgi:hypothetical protein